MMVSFTIYNVLVCLLVLAVGFMLFRTFFDNMIGKEGFAQLEKFVVKTNGDAYDDFYAQIYDSIHLPDPKKEFAEIFKVVNPDSNSVILEVGSGTGTALNLLTDSGASCIGIDKSDAMISVAKDKFGEDLPIIKGDATEPTTFERNRFTHIFCLDFTIYEIENKDAFFTNCRYWLQNGGCLILHLVDKTKFNKVVKAGLPPFIENPQKHVQDSIDKTEIDFHHFTYQSKYKINLNQPSTMVETFTDGTTNHVRQNERTLYMDTDDVVLNIARKCGFSQHAKISMQPINDDEHQNIYILQ